MAIGLVALTAFATGCGQQLGALLYHAGMIPEEKNKSQFKLTQSKLAILIDDPTGALPNPDLRNDIQTTLAADLVEHKVCTTVASPSEMARVERTNRDFDNMSIRAVGEQLHADQVLYVQIQKFSVGDEAKMGIYQGKAKALVKVCSTERKADVRLWPLGGDGQYVEIEQPSEQTEKWTGDNSRASELYARTVCARLGKRVAMLFYEHAAEDERDLTAGRIEKPK